MLKKLIYLFLILFIIFSMGRTGSLKANGTNENKVGKLLSYFPVYSGMEYKFVGKGIEFASFKRDIEYFNKDKSLVQLHDNNGGTIVAKIYSREADQISLIYQQEEFYGKDNLIKEINRGYLVPEMKKIILKTPLQKGTTWKNEREIREITDIDLTLKTSAGEFHDVIEIKIENTESSSGFTTYDYYAPNIGLIYRKSVNQDNYTITSSLESFCVKKEE